MTFDFDKENSLPIKGYLAAEKVTSVHILHLK